MLPLHYTAVLRAGWWPLLYFAVGRLALVVGAAGALVAYEPLVCGRGSGLGAVAQGQWLRGSGSGAVAQLAVLFFTKYEKTAASAVKLGGGWGGGRGKARPSGPRGGFSAARGPEKRGDGGAEGTPSSALFHILLGYGSAFAYYWI